MTDTVSSRPLVDVVRASEVCSFLYREARLADDASYTEWLALWDTRDVLYWVPPNEATDPTREVSYVYDNRERIEQRVARWESGFAWAQNPRSRTNRIVGNVEIIGDDGDTVTARANVHVHVSRRGETSYLVGRVTYRLSSGPDGFRLVQKKVVFLDSSLPVGNITFVL